VPFGSSIGYIPTWSIECQKADCTSLQRVIGIDNLPVNKRLWLLLDCDDLLITYFTFSQCESNQQPLDPVHELGQGEERSSDERRLPQDSRASKQSLGRENRSSLL